MPPFNFSDEEFGALLAASYPLPWELRDRFISEVAQSLQGEALGPGLLYRKVAIQHKYLAEGCAKTGAGKYR